ncbi:hypothetical protein H0H93_006800, partial [Arthromyces matolae]
VVDELNPTSFLMPYWIEENVLEAGWMPAKEHAVIDLAQACWDDQPMPGENRTSFSLGRFGSSLADLGEILARESYKHLFERKTYFLFYLLLQSLRNREAVVFYFKETQFTYLFLPGGEGYHVYKPLHFIQPLCMHLPQYEDHFIWSLMEVQPTQPTLPSFVYFPSSFPILVTSQKEALYKHLIKKREALIYEMPHWNSDELLKWLQLSVEYSAFSKQLEAILPDLTIRHPVVDSNDAIQTAYKILRRHIEDAWDANADDALPSTSNDILIMSVEDALRRLIENAVKLYGPLPQDVFRAVLVDPSGCLQEQENSLSVLTLAMLEEIFDEFRRHNSISAQGPLIICVQSVRGFQSSDFLQVSFKSESIAKRALQQMHNLPLSQIKEGFKRFSYFMTAGVLRHYSKASSILAGQFFELLAHRVLRAAN